jgi:hypothetical protein
MFGMTRCDVRNAAVSAIDVIPDIFTIASKAGASVRPLALSSLDGVALCTHLPRDDRPLHRIADTLRLNRAHCACKNSHQCDEVFHWGIHLVLIGTHDWREYRPPTLIQRKHDHGT